MKAMYGTYEQEKLQEIETWEKTPPSLLSKALGFFAAPLAWGVRKIIPETAMESAISSAFQVAGAFSGSDDLIKEASTIGFEAKSIKDFAQAPLHICDTIARNTAKWAKGIAATEGAVTGVTGFIGLSVDIPAIIILAIRTIRKIGFCYGYDTCLDIERTFVLQVLAAGSANSMEERANAIEKAASLSNASKNISPEGDKNLALQDETLILSKEGFTAAVRNIAKQLSINLTRRKAAQGIPVIGLGVGAAMNASFIGDISEAAIRLYQKRRLEILAVTGSDISTT